MSAGKEAKLYSPEELLGLPDAEGYELIDGLLVERRTTFWTAYVAGELLVRLGTFCHPNRLGWVSSGGVGYQCFPGHPSTVRRPSVSFVGADRLSTAEAMTAGHLLRAPALVVEVISPNDLYYEVDEKVNEWLSAGVPLVWVVNPRTRQVHIHRGDGSDTTARENDQLSGENVVRGFQCRVGDLFQPPPGAAPLPATTSNGNPG